MCRWIAAAALLGLVACAESETTQVDPVGAEAQGQDQAPEPNRAPMDTGAPPVQTAEAAHPAEKVDRSVTDTASPARAQPVVKPSRAPAADRPASEPRSAPPGAALPTPPRPQDAPPDQAPKSPSPLPSTTPPEKMPQQQPPSFSPPEKSPMPGDPPNRVPVPGQMPDAVPLGAR